MPTPTTPFDPINSNNSSEGDEVPYDREMVIGELLALEFDDDPPYTRAELDKLNDDQLCDLYDSEMFGDSVAPGGDDAEEEEEDEEVECSVCGVTKVCDFEDDEEKPICADCEETEESDDGEVESESEEESEEDEDIEEGDES